MPPLCHVLYKTVLWWLFINGEISIQYMRDSLKCHPGEDSIFRYFLIWKFYIPEDLDAHPTGTKVLISLSDSEYIVI